MSERKKKKEREREKRKGSQNRNIPSCCSQVVYTEHSWQETVGVHTTEWHFDCTNSQTTPSHIHNTPTHTHSNSQYYRYHGHPCSILSALLYWMIWIRGRAVALKFNSSTPQQTLLRLKKFQRKSKVSHMNKRTAHLPPHNVYNILTPARYGVQILFRPTRE